MKRILTTTALLLAFLVTDAQEKSSKFTRIYGFASGAVSFGGGIGGDLGVRAVLKDKWSFSVGHMAGAIEAKIPPGYTVTVFDVLLGAFSGGMLMNEANFTYLGAGKYFGKGKSVGFFIEASAGLSKGYYWNFENVNKQIEEKSFGAMLRTGLDFPLASWAGFGFDLHYNYNGGQLADNVGMDLRLMFGKTGKRKR